MRLAPESYLDRDRPPLHRQSSRAERAARPRSSRRATRHGQLPNILLPRCAGEIHTRRRAAAFVWYEEARRHSPRRRMWIRSVGWRGGAWRWATTIPFGQSLLAGRARARCCSGGEGESGRREDGSREGYIDAIAAFYNDIDHQDLNPRARAYEAGMQRVTARIRMTMRRRFSTDCR